MMYNPNYPFQRQLEELKRQLDSLQQNTMTQPIQPIQPIQIQNVPQIATVHGYEGMKNYFIPASGSAVALDADSSDDKLVFYVKVVDSNGIATIKAYDGYERQEATTETESQYVLKSDFDKLVSQISELTDKINTPTVEVIEKLETKTTKGGKA